MSGRFSRMSKSQKAIASYISDHYDEAVFMTAAKLGGAAYQRIYSSALCADAGI